MDDEAQLAGHARVLADGVDVALEGWVLRCVRRGCAGAGIEPDPTTLAAAARAGVACREQVAPAVRRLLGTDIDQQSSTPLTLLRAAVRYPTEVLLAAGVRPVERDEFAVSAFPDDVFALAPASFGDVDKSLVEPGLVWGAAKAHVHLARRRAEGRS